MRKPRTSAKVPSALPSSLQLQQWNILQLPNKMLDTFTLQQAPWQAHPVLTVNFEANWVSCAPRDSTSYFVWLRVHCTQCNSTSCLSGLPCSCRRGLLMLFSLVHKMTTYRPITSGTTEASYSLIFKCLWFAQYAHDSCINVLTD